MKIRKKQAILLFFLFAAVAAIFFFSAQNGEKSSDLSQIFTEKFLEIFRLEGVSIGRAEHFLRKTAHFVEFFALGALLCGFLLSLKKTRLFSCLCSLAIAFCYAAADELHQYFMPGRAASVKDVLLDGTGALCGVLLMISISLLRRRKR